VKSLCVAALVFLLCPISRPQQATDTTWDSWKFLLGEWEEQAGGKPGQGTGIFSFAFDLQGKVLIRKNHSDYPATKERAGYSRDDLMVVYVDPETKHKRAFWADSDGHVVNYDVSVSPDGKSIVFVGDVLPAAPRYRFAYSQIQPNKIAISFEVAPPGHPGRFEKYIDATAVKKPDK
jgi:hypothetical protein